MVAFDDVLADFRAETLQQEAQMSHDRIIAQDGMLVLAQIANTKQEKCPRSQRERKEPFAVEHDADS